MNALLGRPRGHSLILYDHYDNHVFERQITSYQDKQRGGGGGGGEEGEWRKRGRRGEKLYH